MLQELHVRDLALVDGACVRFGPGLNLLTGETGSGKSLIVDALGLSLGARASADQVRQGAERAPRLRPSASTIRDLPLPVSPVSRLRPGPKRTQAPSTRARSLTCSSCNMGKA
jgi:hypothetical protein